MFARGQRTGAAVRLRPVLPMAMRGLAVPAEKRRYISLDAAREAHVQGTPFGRINDPLGRPTERGLALIPLAESQGLGLWGVPSYRVGETAVWGRDRLWAIQQAVLQSDAMASADPDDPTRPGAFNR